MDELKRARYGMYTFLSRIFMSELGLEEVAKLKKIVNTLPEPQRSTVLSEFKTHSTEELYLRLRVDYTKTFLLYIHPYESFFLDETGLLCTDVSTSVKRFYIMAGYEPVIEEARVRCFDHIGLELAFMAKLIEENRLDLQYRFLKQHLVRWAPVFGIVVSEVASTKFYSAMGELLAEFVVEDYRYVHGLAGR